MPEAGTSYIMDQGYVAELAGDSSDISPAQMEWTRLKIKIPSGAAVIEYHIPVHSLCHPDRNTPETRHEVQQPKRQTKDHWWNTQKSWLSSHRDKHPSDHLFVSERL